MAKTDKPVFKLTVKNGDIKYVLDQNGQYKTKPMDFVEEYDTFAAALEVLAGYVIDEYNEETVTLTFKPNKKK